MRPVEAVLITITVILLLFIQLNQKQFVVFRLMYELWENRCPTVLTAAKLTSTKNSSITPSVYASSVPHPGDSCDLHYFDVRNESAKF